MRQLIVSLALGLVVGSVSARADDKEAKSDEKQSRLDTINSIEKEFREREQELLKQFRAAESDEEKATIYKKFTEGSLEFAERAMKVVEKNPKDEAGFQGLKFVAETARIPTLRDKAFKLMEEHHVNKDEFADVLPRMMSTRSADAAKRFKEIAEKSTSEKVKAIASFSAAEALFEQSERGGAAARKKELVEQAEELFEQVQAEFGEVAMRGRKVGDRAKAYLFQIRNLGIGMKAPDIEATTLEGKKEKLADYQGKVVVLDVWATWCGPCRAMIPHEREMVESLKDKPFALISISADDTKDELKRFLEEEEMPWVHWYNGPKGGMVSKWNIRYFPTIYVLDTKGVIRYKDIRGEQLEEAVHTLLDEAGGKNE